MFKKLWIAALVGLIILPLVMFGCKEKAQKMPETQATMESPDVTTTTEAALGTQAQVPEPAQGVATETIPPTAAPQMAGKTAPVVQPQDRNKDIQRALKNAGFYAGPIDGKIGPKTRKAIEDFQRAKGLRVDGRVGPKTWAELEKYLTQ